MSDQERILVIKHGALGDIIMSTGSFAAIRSYHARAHITVLTTPPFVDLLHQSPYFDDIWCDSRLPIWRISPWLSLRRSLIKARFKRVYDLQTSQRTGLYFRMIPKAIRPAWSGMAKGCSLPHANPDRDSLHTIERLADQLHMAGIPDIPHPNLDWLRADIEHFALPHNHPASPSEPAAAGSGGKTPARYTGYVLLIASCSSHRQEKRWPAEQFGNLSTYLITQNLLPVLIGTKSDSLPIRRICEICPQARDLCGLTSLAELAQLARGAKYSVANDTGPAHIASRVGCPIIVLFSRHSDFRSSAPCGPYSRILHQDDLTDLSLESVIAAIEALPDSP